MRMEQQLRLEVFLSVVGVLFLVGFLCWGFYTHAKAPVDAKADQQTMQAVIQVKRPDDTALRRSVEQKRGELDVALGQLKILADQTVRLLQECRRDRDQCAKDLYAARGQEKGQEP